MPKTPDSVALVAFLANRRRFPDLALVVVKPMGSGEYVMDDGAVAIRPVATVGACAWIELIPSSWSEPLRDRVESVLGSEGEQNVSVPSAVQAQRLLGRQTPADHLQARPAASRATERPRRRPASPRARRWCRGGFGHRSESNPGPGSAGRTTTR